MKKPKPPKLVTVAIFTTITVIFWIFFEVYETLSSVPTVNVSDELLAPINPTLDTAALQKLETRTYFEESDVSGIRFSDLSQPTVSTPVITPSVNITLPNSETKPLTGTGTNINENSSVTTSPESE